MESNENSSEELVEKLVKITNSTAIIYFATIILLLMVLMMPQYFSGSWLDKGEEELAAVEEISIVDSSDIENGIHLPTGLIADQDFEIVMSQCTGCHSAKLVTQNRATREGWLEIIRWMQETQKLWDLGENEAAILDYLARNYAPEEKGRREPLTNIDWYELEN